MVFSDLIRCQVYTRIDFKFLIPGHTYGPTDRHFAVIEKYAANIETIYTALQWYDHVREAITKTGSKIEVVEMEQRSFRNYRQHLRKLYTERNKHSDNHPLDFALAVWFNLEQGRKWLMESWLCLSTHKMYGYDTHTMSVKYHSVYHLEKGGVSKRESTLLLHLCMTAIPYLSSKGQRLMISGI